MSSRSIITVFVVLGLLAEWSLALGSNLQSRPASFAVKIESIAVMPFFEGISGYDSTEMLDSTASRFGFDNESLSSNAAQIISRYVQEALVDRHGTRVVRLRDSVESYEQMGKDETRDTPRFLAQKLGKELKVSHIMMGTVWRYRERIGGSYGVERPASVAFAVYLIDVVNGKLLWTESFEETQRSLSENLLAAPAFLKRRGRWLSAMELTEYGIREIFSKYPF